MFDIRAKRDKKHDRHPNVEPKPVKDPNAGPAPKSKYRTPATIPYGVVPHTPRKPTWNN